MGEGVEVLVRPVPMLGSLRRRFPPRGCGRSLERTDLGEEEEGARMVVEPCG